MVDKFKRIGVCMYVQWQNINKDFSLGLSLIEQIRDLGKVNGFGRHRSDIDSIIIEEVPDNTQLTALHHRISAALIVLDAKDVQVIYPTQDNEARYNSGTFDYIFTSYHLIPQPQDRN